jgi:hypothetical protein
MKTAWILMILVHGCTESSSQVNAFESEVECRKALDVAQEKRSFFTEVRAQCASVDYLLKEGK